MMRFTDDIEAARAQTEFDRELARRVSLDLATERQRTTNLPRILQLTARALESGGFAHDRIVHVRTSSNKASRFSGRPKLTGVTTQTYKGWSLSERVMGGTLYDTVLTEDAQIGALNVPAPAGGNTREVTTDGAHFIIMPLDSGLVSWSHRTLNANSLSPLLANFVVARGIDPDVYNGL